MANIHEINEGQERAILVSMRTTKKYASTEVADYSLKELRKLAETAGVECVTELIQNRPKVDTKWFIGQGKAEELKGLVEQFEVQTIIFDGELSGGQVRNLEQLLDCKIIDRTQLILDIFAQRASTREGILQVELAQLQYLLPRLSGHGKNLSRLGGGIGTRGPGETKLETDRRHIRDRISDLKAQINEVNRHRTLYRERRQKNGVVQVALVGYTNAGKSTLLNRLTKSAVYADNVLFATLDPTSRVLQLANGREVVLTDTVGFIQHLPHELVAAFRATLEEVCEADLIVHVVDSASSMRELQMQVVDQVLTELGAHQKQQLTLFNKIDLLDETERTTLITEPPFMRVSSLSEQDLIDICAHIQQLLSGDTVTFHIPFARGDLLALVYRIGEVLNQEVDEEGTSMQVIVDRREYERFGYTLEPFVRQR